MFTMSLSIGQKYAIRWARNVMREGNKSKVSNALIKYRQPQNLIMTYEDKIFKEIKNKKKELGKKFPNRDDFTMFMVIASVGTLIYNC